MNLLVNPATMVQDGYSPPPLGLLYLAAMDRDTVVFDAALKGDPIPFIREHSPRTVGVTMYTPGRMESLNILKAAREAGAVTVAGGPHTSLMTEQLLREYPFIDHLVLGDGEAAWKAICSGDELPRVVRMPVRDLDQLPLPRWSAVDLLSYPARGGGVVRGLDLGRVPRISVVLGRGCEGRCIFCSTWWVNGRYRSHGTEWMRRNLLELWEAGVRHLVFQDDCLTCDRKAALDLCDVLLDFGFAWFGTSRADMIDIELATRMKACGCYELSFGIESGSREMLRRLNKRMDLEKAVEARIICHKAGIRFTALMMSGLPFETDRSRIETEQFLRYLKPDGLGTLGFVMVLPGTELYRQCRDKGLIDDSFWLSSEPYYVYKGGLS